MVTYGFVIYSEDQPCLYDVHCSEKENLQKSIKVTPSDGTLSVGYKNGAFKHHWVSCRSRNVLRTYGQTIFGTNWCPQPTRICEDLQDCHTA